MTDRFYDAGGSGSNTSPYDTAAKAATTLAAALGARTALDETIYVLNTSNEAKASGGVYAGATYASAAKPQKVYSVSSLSSPALSFGAKIKPNADAGYIAFLDHWEFYGIHFDFDVGTSASQLNLGNYGDQYTNIYAEDCKYSRNTSASTNNHCKIGTYGGSSYYPVSIRLKNFTVNCKSTGTPLQIGAGENIIDNLILTGTSNPTTLFGFLSGAILDFVLKNSDLTGLAWTNLFDVASMMEGRVRVIDCKIPSGITVYTGTINSRRTEIILINVSSADINYQYAKYCLAGSIITIDSIYATTSPMQVGEVSVSDLFTSSSVCGRGQTLSREYFVEVADNTSVTPFAELLVQTSGAAALKNNEVYITAETVTVAGTTQGSQVTSKPSQLATPADCSAGTTAYTGDGYATERTHRVETASITTRQAGLVKITVHLAKASTAIYVGQVGVA